MRVLANLMIVRGRRIVAVGLSACLLFTSASSSWAEAGFWQERRAVRERQSQVASAAGAPAALSLPGVEAGEASRIVTRSLSDASQDPLLKPLRGSDLLRALPLSHTTVRDVYLPTGGYSQFVIHIQDVHGQREAQDNIAKAVEHIEAEARRRDGRAALVALEGAAGPFLTDAFRAFPDRDVLADVSKAFFDKDLLTGAEFAALQAPTAPQLWGVEDLPLYEGHIAAVKEGFTREPALREAVQNLEARAARLKSIYPQPLKAWDDASAAYHEGKLPLGAYVRFLSGAAPQGRRPNVARFLAALSLEDAIDFKTAESDRKKLVESLSRRLSAGDLRALGARAVDFRLGRIGHRDFNDALAAATRQAGLSLAGFPAFQEYIGYVAQVERIDRGGLLREIDLLEQDAAAQALSGAPAEVRRLFEACQDLGGVKKLLARTMTPGDWARYAPRRDEAHRLPARLNADAPRFAEDATLFENFYVLAEARNAALVDRLLSKAGEEPGRGPRVATLVAGGFHTEGVTALLKKKGVAYVVLAPRLDKIGPGEYLDVFRQDKTPLERLFESPKVTIVEPLGLAASRPRPQEGRGRVPFEIASVLLGKAISKSGEEYDKIHSGEARAAAYAKNRFAVMALAREKMAQWMTGTGLDVQSTIEPDGDIIVTAEDGSGREFLRVSFQPAGVRGNVLDMDVRILSSDKNAPLQIRRALARVRDALGMSRWSGVFTNRARLALAAPVAGAVLATVGWLGAGTAVTLLGAGIAVAGTAMLLRHYVRARPDAGALIQATQWVAVTVGTGLLMAFARVVSQTPGLNLVTELLWLSAAPLAAVSLRFLRPSSAVSPVSTRSAANTPAARHFPGRTVLQFSGNAVTFVMPDRNDIVYEEFVGRGVSMINVKHYLPFELGGEVQYDVTSLGSYLIDGNELKQVKIRSNRVDLPKPGGMTVIGPVQDLTSLSFEKYVPRLKENRVARVKQAEGLDAGRRLFGDSVETVARVPGVHGYRVRGTNLFVEETRAEDGVDLTVWAKDAPQGAPPLAAFHFGDWMNLSKQEHRQLLSILNRRAQTGLDLQRERIAFGREDLEPLSKLVAILPSASLGETLFGALSGLPAAARWKRVSASMEYQNEHVFNFAGLFEGRPYQVQEVREGAKSTLYVVAGKKRIRVNTTVDRVRAKSTDEKRQLLDRIHAAIRGVPVTEAKASVTPNSEYLLAAQRAAGLTRPLAEVPESSPAPAAAPSAPASEVAPAAPTTTPFAAYLEDWVAFLNKSDRRFELVKVDGKTPMFHLREPKLFARVEVVQEGDAVVVRRDGQAVARFSLSAAVQARQDMAGVLLAGLLRRRILEGIHPAEAVDVDVVRSAWLHTMDAPQMAGSLLGKGPWAAIAESADGWFTYERARPGSFYFRHRETKDGDAFQLVAREGPHAGAVIMTFEVPKGRYLSSGQGGRMARALEPRLTDTAPLPADVSFPFAKPLPTFGEVIPLQRPSGKTSRNSFASRAVGSTLKYFLVLLALGYPGRAGHEGDMSPAPRRAAAPTAALTPPASPAAPVQTPAVLPAPITPDMLPAASPAAGPARAPVKTARAVVRKAAPAVPAAPAAPAANVAAPSWVEEMYSLGEQPAKAAAKAPPAANTQAAAPAATEAKAPAAPDKQAASNEVPATRPGLVTERPAAPPASASTAQPASAAQLPGQDGGLAPILGRDTPALPPASTSSGPGSAAPANAPAAPASPEKPGKSGFSSGAGVLGALTSPAARRRAVSIASTAAVSGAFALVSFALNRGQGGMPGLAMMAVSMADPARSLGALFFLGTAALTILGMLYSFKGDGEGTSDEGTPPSFAEEHTRPGFAAAEPAVTRQDGKPDSEPPPGMKRKPSVVMPSVKGGYVPGSVVMAPPESIEATKTPHGPPARLPTPAGPTGTAPLTPGKPAPGAEKPSAPPVARKGPPPAPVRNRPGPVWTASVTNNPFADLPPAPAETPSQTGNKQPVPMFSLEAVKRESQAPPAPEKPVRWRVPTLEGKKLLASLRPVQRPAVEPPARIAAVLTPVRSALELLMPPAPSPDPYWHQIGPGRYVLARSRLPYAVSFTSVVLKQNPSGIYELRSEEADSDRPAPLAADEREVRFFSVTQGDAQILLPFAGDDEDMEDLFTVFDSWAEWDQGATDDFLVPLDWVPRLLDLAREARENGDLIPQQTWMRQAGLMRKQGEVWKSVIRGRAQAKRLEEMNAARMAQDLLLPPSMAEAPPLDLAGAAAAAVEKAAPVLPAEHTLRLVEAAVEGIVNAGGGSKAPAASVAPAAAPVTTETRPSELRVKSDNDEPLQGSVTGYLFRVAKTTEDTLGLLQHEFEGDEFSGIYNEEMSDHRQADIVFYAKGTGDPFLSMTIRKRELAALLKKAASDPETLNVGYKIARRLQETVLKAFEKHKEAKAATGIGTLFEVPEPLYRPQKFQSSLSPYASPIDDELWDLLVDQWMERAEAFFRLEPAPSALQPVHTAPAAPVDGAPAPAETAPALAPAAPASPESSPVAPALAEPAPVEPEQSVFVPGDVAFDTESVMDALFGEDVPDLFPDLPGAEMAHDVVTAAQAALAPEPAIVTPADTTLQEEPDLELTPVQPLPIPPAAVGPKATARVVAEITEKTPVQRPAPEAAVQAKTERIENTPTQEPAPTVTARMETTPRSQAQAPNNALAKRVVLDAEFEPESPEDSAAIPEAFAEAVKEVFQQLNKQAFEDNVALHTAKEKLAAARSAARFWRKAALIAAGLLLAASAVFAGPRLWAYINSNPAEERLEQRMAEGRKRIDEAKRKAAAEAAAEAAPVAPTATPIATAVPEAPAAPVVENPVVLPPIVAPAVEAPKTPAAAPARTSVAPVVKAPAAPVAAPAARPASPAAAPVAPARPAAKPAVEETPDYGIPDVPAPAAAPKEKAPAAPPAPPVEKAPEKAPEQPKAPEAAPAPGKSKAPSKTDFANDLLDSLSTGGSWLKNRNYRTFAPGIETLFLGGLLGAAGLPALAAFPLIFKFGHWFGNREAMNSQAVNELTLHKFVVGATAVLFHLLGAATTDPLVWPVLALQLAVVAARHAWINRTAAVQERAAADVLAEESALSDLNAAPFLRGPVLNDLSDVRRASENGGGGILEAFPGLSLSGLRVLTQALRAARLEQALLNENRALSVQIEPADLAVEGSAALNDLKNILARVSEQRRVEVFSETQAAEKLSDALRAAGIDVSRLVLRDRSQAPAFLDGSLLSDQKYAERLRAEGLPITGVSVITSVPDRWVKSANIIPAIGRVLTDLMNAVETLKLAATHA